MALQERKLWKQASVEEIKDFVIKAYTQEAENPCPVDKMRAFTDIIRRTSCGECVICREGILQLNLMAEGITQGTGRDGDIEVITEVAEDLIIGSCCNYGKEVGKIAKKIIESDQEQFEKHIKRRRCDAVVCKKFFSYYVAPEKCNGCNNCVNQCPKKAIDGGKDLIHIIDSSLCNRCGECVSVCEAFAIQKSGPVVPKVPTEPIAVGSFEKQLENGGGLMARKRRRRSE